jgi:transcriptional regulator with XRE-family HTH domain
MLHDSAMAFGLEGAVALVSRSEEPRAKRQRLAAELRQLRESAGVSGRELAQRIGTSQSKVSRIESGVTMPPVPAVERWAYAVGASAEVRARLTAMTEAAFAEIQAWRAELPVRGHLQDQIERREAAARTVRVFQPSVVPGLLQTAEYARRVFGLFHVPYEADDLARAIAGRLNRQLALYDQDRRFAFLITEAALRWRPGPPKILHAQLDRISSLTTLENVSIGLIPCDVEATTGIPTGFDILDGPDGETAVTIETHHANLIITEPGDTGEYEQVWSLLTEMAVFDEHARVMLGRIQAAIGEITR